MAMTPEEKKAYQREYYQKYKKKGLKKGRKKGSKKAASSSLLGTSTSGLNSEGKIEAGLIKEKLKKEMNTALAKAKTPEEKENIRREYSKKASSELQQLKNNPKFAQVKASKGSSGGSKGSSGKSSTGTSGKSSSGGSAVKIPATVKASIDSLSKRLDNISGKMENLSDKEKADLKIQIQGMLTRLRAYIAKQTG